MTVRGLSEKRIELLKVIDSHGILTRKQIHGFMDIAEINLFKGIKRLEELGFIATYKLARGYAHYITKSGSEYLGMINFGYVSRGNKQPNLATVEHNLTVIDCILRESAYLQDNIGRAIPLQVITEREQLAESYLSLDLRNSSSGSRAVRTRSRVPDFLLSFSNEGEQVINAYEVELSRKNKTALLSKLSWYQQEKVKGIYDNIIYLCENSSVKNHVKTNAEQIGLKVYFRGLG